MYDAITEKMANTVFGRTRCAILEQIEDINRRNQGPEWFWAKS